MLPKSIGIHLREFGSKQQDLGGVVHPDEHNHQRAGGAKATGDLAFPKIKTDGEFSDGEQERGDSRSHPDVRPSDVSFGQNLEDHATLEEQLIYPAIREEIDAEDIMDEALEEHHVAHTLINELKRMSPSEDRYDAKFTVLGENIKHHVKEEENSMFPEAEKADLNWEELAQQAMERKEVLKARKGSSGKNGRSAKAKGEKRSGTRQVRKAA